MDAPQQNDVNFGFTWDVYRVSAQVLFTSACCDHLGKLFINGCLHRNVELVADGCPTTVNTPTRTPYDMANDDSAVGDPTGKPSRWRTATIEPPDRCNRTRC